MKVLISGASGLVGSALLSVLQTQGHQVVKLVRYMPRDSNLELHWDPQTGHLDAEALEGFNAVIHLAGENIAEGRWSEEKKARILDSRVKGTRLLSQTFQQLAKPPKVFITASAIGYYGDRKDETLDESSGPGHDFLADVCQAWEAASHSAIKKGIRVANLRFGIILSTQGGALAKMLPPFKMGLGGPLGSGQQFMSWVSLEDVVGAIIHVLEHPDVQGAINVVSPNPVTNRLFSQVLGRILHRPAVAPVPTVMVRILFGEMGEALLLSSDRVLPKKLLESGYSFQYSTLEQALQHIVG